MLNASHAASLSEWASLTDDAPTLDVVLLELDAWLEEQGLRNTPEHGSLAL